jgi:AraC-like DNA-binding protein
MPAPEGEPIPALAAPPHGASVRISRMRFTDADHLSEETRHARIEVTLAGGRGYRGGLITLEAPELNVQWGFHGVPVIVSGQVKVPAILSIWGNGGLARCNGQAMARGVLFYPAETELQARSEGACGRVSASVSNLESLARSLAPDLDLAEGSGRRYADGAREAVAVIRSLLLTARRAVESGGAALRDASARRALAEQLGMAIVRAVAGDRPNRRREGIAACAALVRGAEEILRARRYQPVSVPELCAALGASEARLREAFQRIYGTGPSSFLRLRRLHLVRRKLRTTRREECTVSAAASSLGFYEFGRFAGEYRAVFGELPSQTERAR